LLFIGINYFLHGTRAKEAEIISRIQENCKAIFCTENPKDFLVMQEPANGFLFMNIGSS
jgi:hypothetical protein